MLVLVDLFEFEVIVTPELGVASSHGVGGFQQVVAEIAVAGFNHSGVFGLEVARLAPVPDKAGVFGNRGLGIKTVDITNLSNDTGGVDLADTGNGSQGVWDNLKWVFNGLVQIFFGIVILKKGLASRRYRCYNIVILYLSGIYVIPLCFD